jgi:hypothetical protein
MEVRVAVCGSANSGKSCIIDKLICFNTRLQSLVQGNISFIEVNNPSPSFELDYSLVIVAFDLTNDTSYEDALDLVRSIQYVPRMLVGTKADLASRRVIDRSTVIKDARYLDVFYRELSALEPSEAQELSEIIDDILEFQLVNTAKWRLKISNKRYTQLTLTCRWLSVTTMAQGLIMLCFGSLMFLYLENSEQWLADTQMFGGLLTFMVAFLGFYGSRYSGIAEYLGVVRTKQYLLLVCLVSAYKLGTLIAIAASEFTLHYVIHSSFVSLKMLYIISGVSLFNDVTSTQLFIIVFNVLERIASGQRRTNLHVQISSNGSFFGR